jgi:hypothetical protein
VPGGPAPDLLLIEPGESFGGLEGFLDTPALTGHPHEGGVGSSLAEADLAIFYPSTWSAIRRTKDNQERYLVQADPSVGEVNTI